MATKYVWYGSFIINIEYQDALLNSLYNTNRSIFPKSQNNYATGVLIFIAHYYYIGDKVSVLLSNDERRRLLRQYPS